jgi:hypothetical protein
MPVCPPAGVAALLRVCMSVWNVLLLPGIGNTPVKLRCTAGLPPEPLY